MPVLFLRHAVTAKNRDGGIDNPATPLLDPDGFTQAAESGVRLLQLCRRLEVSLIQPITSDHLRTHQTWNGASTAFAGQPIAVLPAIEDKRIGEIKFKPREFVPSADNPGLFGRVIDGGTLAQRVAAANAFDSEHLRAVPSDRLTVVVGHRSTTRLLAMVHAGRDFAWLESLPRLNNCEMWLATPSSIEVFHQGYASSRDEPDPRRANLAVADAGSITGDARSSSF